MFVVIGPVWAKCFVGLAFVAFSRDGFLSSKRDDWLFVNLPIFTQFGRAAHVNQRPLDMYRKVFSKMLRVGVIYPKTSQLKGRYLTQTNLQPKGRIAKRLFTPHCSPLQGPCSFWGRITLFALSPNKLSKAKGIFHWDVGNSHCACAAADFRISNFFTARWYA